MWAHSRWGARHEASECDDHNPRKRKKVVTATVTPGACVDSNEQCTEWAFFGECEKNPQFMRDTCKKSCGVCGSKKVPLQVTA
mmetsp:Transcript_4979/g.8675  ORF Transcript_4979/g.8675 Transcript_4979/m.8675 type:complete len:83 (-) Transcript_4979:305-553(-)